MLYSLIRPLLMALDPETAHRLTLRAMADNLLPSLLRDVGEHPILHTEVWGHSFASPVGIAAGFDKDAVAAKGLMSVGFSFVEVGTVTPLPQAGNPRPRLFRLPEDRAVINRMGFNNGGLAGLCARLAALEDRRTPLIVNIGANKDSPDRIGDYVTGLKAVAGLADLVTINVSSPNTPGLRGLQDAAALTELLGRLTAVEFDLPSYRPKLLLKIAPDLDDAALADIAAVVRAHDLAGVIVTNTTITRPGLKSRHRDEAGGLSGRPLFELSTDRLRGMYRELGGQVPLIGVGGVEDGATAYAKIRAGASLVQLYTALVYEGPQLIGRIKRELADRLRRDGFASVADAVGADA